MGPAPALRRNQYVIDGSVWGVGRLLMHLIKKPLQPSIFNVKVR